MDAPNPMTIPTLTERVARVVSQADVETLYRAGELETLMTILPLRCGELGPALRAMERLAGVSDFGACPAGRNVLATGLFGDDRFAVVLIPERVSFTY